MDKSDEEKDLYIKSKIKDGHIPEKIDNLFNNSINLEKERGINMNINEINEPQKIKPKKLWVKRTIATAACAVIVLGGGNIYATTQGYENIFFMIKHLVTKDETVHNDKSDILSDRDITISYETINLTENIVMQVQKIQINGKEAKLILAIKEKEAEIVEFAELGDFIDMPVRTYSSGMYSKLAFSITAILETDIMLIDEVLSVGDQKFKKKSYEKMKSLISNKDRTVIIVSHSLDTLEELCDTVMWMHDGQIRRIGEPKPVLEEYVDFMEKN